MRNIYICFPEGKHKVLTMSFDDGRVEDRQLVDMFNRYGIRGDFSCKFGDCGRNKSSRFGISGAVPGA